MSIESVAKALNVPGVNGRERLVLIGIANHDGDGGSWPSIATLARYACMSPRQVQRYIASMRDRGWIEVDLHAGGSKDTPDNKRPNKYRIIWTAFAKDQRVGTTQDVTPNGGGVTDSTVRGDAQMSSEPSLNHPSVSSENAFTFLEIERAASKIRQQVSKHRSTIIAHGKARNLANLRPVAPLELLANALLGEEHGLMYWLAENRVDSDETIPP